VFHHLVVPHARHTKTRKFLCHEISISLIKKETGRIDLLCLSVLITWITMLFFSFSIHTESSSLPSASWN
ncbi:hypothetical protein, partial [Gemmiger formicilis]|uniref:hypothetical protein n=1 Tax=Gemmiger formicilis TaxID=745368 RepID=UPI003C6D8488